VTLLRRRPASESSHRVAIVPPTTAQSKPVARSFSPTHPTIGEYRTITRSARGLATPTRAAPTTVTVTEDAQKSTPSVAVLVTRTLSSPRRAGRVVTLAQAKRGELGSRAEPLQLRLGSAIRTGWPEKFSRVGLFENDLGVQRPGPAKMVNRAHHRAVVQTQSQRRACGGYCGIAPHKLNQGRELKRRGNRR